MASFNRTILLGNLTRDPEVRQSQSGTTVCKASIAVNDRVPDGSGGYRDEASFFDMVIFGKQAESFERFFSKGRPVLVEGKLRQNRWEDRESGQKRSKIEVVVDRWHFVDSRESGRDSAPAPAATQTDAGGSGFPAAADFGGGDDVPF